MSRCEKIHRIIYAHGILDLRAIPSLIIVLSTYFHVFLLENEKFLGVSPTMVLFTVGFDRVER